MKTLFARVLCLLTMVVLTACAGKQPVPLVGIANPYVSCDTLEDAAAISGFGLQAPDVLTNYPQRRISAIKDEMIQIVYFSGENEVVVRKAKGSEDVSGDYNPYAFIQTIAAVDLEGIAIQVEVRGASENQVQAAVWTNGEYAYALVINGAGMSVDAARLVIGAIA